MADAIRVDRPGVDTGPALDLWHALRALIRQRAGIRRRRRQDVAADRGGAQHCHRPRAAEGAGQGAVQRLDGEPRRPAGGDAAPPHGRLHVLQRQARGDRGAPVPRRRPRHADPLRNAGARRHQRRRRAGRLHDRQGQAEQHRAGVYRPVGGRQRDQRERQRRHERSRRGGAPRGRRDRRRDRASASHQEG